MIDEVKVCACGLQMVPTKPGSSVVICPNEDVIQPREYCALCGPSEECQHDTTRIPTTFDRRFKLAWVQRERVYYPNQFPNGKAA